MSYRMVSEQVAHAADRAGRDPDEVTLVVVSKNREVSRIRDLYDQGVRDFGENRAQELAGKVALLPSDIRWHFVGPLQTNKVKLVRPSVHLLHSMDREKLARFWIRNAPSPAAALAQVNIGCEPQKKGVAPDRIEDVVEGFLERGVKLRGLMAMAPRVDSPELARPYFRRLRRLSERIRERHPALTELSMGMTEDFQVAVEEGATMVRVGRAIFGEGS
jgi:hypothetical protein